MELRTHGLHAIFKFNPPDDEGWMFTNLIVNVPGFRGDLDLQVMRADLETFRDQLVRSQEPARWPCEVAFLSTETNINICLKIENSGQIQGCYRFHNDTTGGASLSGGFSMDQTHLRPLLDQVHHVLKDLG